MAVLAVSKASTAGVVPTFVAANAGGDSFVNDGNATLLVKNGDASSKTVTVNSTKKCDQGFDHDAVVVVAAGAQAIIGPFPVARFGRSVGITYSAVTSVTVAVVTE